MTTHARILLVDDEPSIRFAVRDFLELHGYDVVEAWTCSGGREAFLCQVPDAVLLDYSLPDGNALDLLPVLRAADPTVPVIVLTAHGSIDLAVRAIKEGAEQFLTKPIELPTLLVMLQRAMEHQRNWKARATDQSRGSRDAVEVFGGTSPAMRRLEREARIALDASGAVLLTGETGVGKGVIARWLHHNGRRATEPFVDLNCAGLSGELTESELFGHQRGAFTGAVAAKVGLLEVAHRGTLFLDEIGDMDLSVQARLLKVLEEQRFRRVGDVHERRVDVRLISATHHDLEAGVRDGKFRDDLYYRVAAVPLRVPPLRERPEDLLPLAHGILTRLAAESGRAPVQLSPDAADALEAYSWPGNIRELRNVLERALLTTRGPTIDAGLLHLGRNDVAPPENDDDLPVDATMDEVQRRHIERVLRHHHGHVDRAAVALGMSRSTLYEKVKRYGLGNSDR